jgi:hypothetical protein
MRGELGLPFARPESNDSDAPVAMARDATVLLMPNDPASLTAATHEGGFASATPQVADDKLVRNDRPPHGAGE